MIPIPEVHHEDVRRRLAHLGIVQGDDPILRQPSRRLSLPHEMSLARSILDELLDTIKNLRHVHRFNNGVGISAPQIGHSLAVALVRPINNYPIRLLNPRITSTSRRKVVEYEGCLSFFDYRGRVPRPASIVVESVDLRGRSITRRYEGQIARLVAHEVDHLHGKLYVDLMSNKADLIDISAYKSQRWQ